MPPATYGSEYSEGGEGAPTASGSSTSTSTTVVMAAGGLVAAVAVVVGVAVALVARHRRGSSPALPVVRRQSTAPGKAPRALVSVDAGVMVVAERLEVVVVSDEESAPVPRRSHTPAAPPPTTPALALSPTSPCAPSAQFQVTTATPASDAPSEVTSCAQTMGAVAGARTPVANAATTPNELDGLFGL